MWFIRFISILLILNLTQSGFLSGQDLPPGWDYQITNLFHPVAIPLSANPSLFEDPAAPGDYIGVFFVRNDSLICAGASAWSGDENIAVVAFGDDNMTPLKDGFYINETIQWKIYSWDYEADFIATATYDPSMPNSNGKFYPGGLSALTGLWYGSALEVSAHASPDTLCIGNTSQLTASASGGSESYTYQWTSIPDGFSSTEQNPVAVPLYSTSYIVLAEDGFNSVADTISVTVIQLPEVTAGNDTLICENGLVSLEGAALNAQSVLWFTDGDGTFEGSSLLITTYLPGPADLEDGLIKLTLRAWSIPPCIDSVTDFLYVSLSPLPVIDAGTDDAICAGGSFTVTGYADHVSSTEWSSSGDGVFDNPFYLGATYYPGEEDILSGEVILILSAYPVAPCTSSTNDSLTLTIHPLPEVNAGVDHWIPYGTSTQLNGTVTGGSGEYYYSWQPPEYLVDPATEDPMTVNLFQSIEFTLTGTDAQTFCFDLDTAVVFVTGGPLSVVASASPGNTCAGSPSKLMALPSGGSGNYSYSWTSDPPGYSSDEQDPLVFPVQTTTYTVTINDGFNTAADEVMVTIYALPEASAGEDQSISYGTSTTLEGSATGGSGDYTYQWTPAQYLVNPMVKNPLTTNLTHTVEFMLEVTDILTQCQDQDTVTVTVIGGPLQVDVSATPSDICTGDSSKLNTLVSGGSGNYSYFWASDPPGFFSDLPDPVVSPGMSTDYFVQVFDGYNSVSGYITIDVYPLPFVKIEAFPDDTVCAGETIQLDASIPGGIGYYWLPNGQTSPSIQIDSAGIGFGSKMFTVYVTTLAGCTGIDSMEVTFYNCVGIAEDPSQTIDLHIYPNPVSDRLSVRLGPTFFSLDNSSSSVTFSLEIADITGRKLQHFDLQTNESLYSFSIAILPPGIYLILLKKGELVFSSGKVIVR